MLITNKNGENPELRTGREATSHTSSPRNSAGTYSITSPNCSSQVSVLCSPPSSRFRLHFDAALVESDDVLLLPLCDIYEAISNMMSSWNCVFQVAVVDLSRKVERIRMAVSDEPHLYRTMQAAADNERTVGIFLRKENAGITQILISLHRTMRFTIAFLDGIRRADANTEMSVIAREAYATSVAHHHNWATRKMSSAVMSSVPGRREMMGSILKQDGNGVGEAEFLDGLLQRAEMAVSPVFFVQLICTVEGVIGTLLNLALPRSLLRSRGSGNVRVYRVNIFREGMFVIALLSPIVPYLPRSFCDVIEQQQVCYNGSLCRAHWKPPKRLAVGFSFTFAWVWLAPQFVPCDEFHDILESVFRDLYTIDDTTRLVMYGGTLMNTERNKDRSMMTLLILYCFDPYISLRTLSSQFSSFLWIRRRFAWWGVAFSKTTVQMQRDFFRMQMLQSFLPLAILMLPDILFGLGVFLQWNLDFVTLFVMYTLFLCPSIPIYISAIKGLELSSSLALMNYVNIFHDGTFAIPLFGPIVPYLPRIVCDIIEQVGLVFTTMLWTIHPATSLLQWMAMCRAHWTTNRRILIGFSFTAAWIVIVAFLVPGFVPTEEFHEELETIARDLYEIRRRLLSWGIVLSAKTTRMQRDFFIMQMLQSCLPLCILSIPVTLFMIGAVLQSRLDFFTLLLTYTLWLCPIVQAIVQYRFVHQSQVAPQEKSSSTRSTHSVQNRQ
ncbi:hypothetical protein PRIPAC_78107 [Pristionchus pacificus]|uniref:G protein-coupled receptor n=1 Tax=Pristionchus pacificus TaxID=54126 RepID=A0A2A6C245_PRIPA|nr:hypothetical protein PRIPAC_78107 [Pristionchus pacificus]|eukprot:PDM72178.1 G protein-coupled receptor [Pristionchus pacificus]